MEKRSLADKLITGFLIILGMAETGHLLMVFGHRPFSDAVICFAAESVLAAAVCYAWVLRGRMHGKQGVNAGTKRSIRKGAGKNGRAAGGLTGRDITPALAGYTLVFGLLVLMQIMTLDYGEAVSFKGDQTVETVQTILETGEIYACNPLTGRAYTAGIPSRIKILGLPTFYAILCRLSSCLAGDISGGSALCVDLVTKWIPVAVLALSYLVYWSLAGAFFSEPKDREKRMLFMAFTAAVFWAGNTMFGLDGFGLLYCGYRGITVRNCILVPYTFRLMLGNRWKQALLCVLAEACIVWTLYGLGACAAVMALMTVLSLWQSRRKEKLQAGLRSGVSAKPIRMRGGEE